MTTLVEQTRLLHQDIETNRAQIVDELLQESKTTKDRILQEHRVKSRLERIQASATQLLDLYEDTDKARAAELEEMTGENVFSTFYEQLKDIREHHRNFPEALPADAESGEIKAKVRFQGAEVNGIFLDLHPFFERYINMPVFQKTDYRSFLGVFDKLAQVEKNKKLKSQYKDYKQYTQDLFHYLADFQQRTNALVDVSELVAIVDEEFEKAWGAKTVAGWQDAAGSNGAPAKVDENDPLYCKPCAKLFTKTTTFTTHLSGKKHKKALANKGEKPTTKIDDPREKELAKLEFRVQSFADLLRETIMATQEFVEKKQTRTYEEMAADLEEQQEEEVISSSDDEEDEKPIYNPLNLPLGWDGKPIPYWLYKFHGLNIERKCDICGGYSYWGPRAFERHFTEWRHTYGLRCLGITNSPEYGMITKFEDAIALNEKLTGVKSAGWKPDDDEEFEDDEGNVFNKRTYEDLKRQGII